MDYTDQPVMSSVQLSASPRTTSPSSRSNGKGTEAPGSQGVCNRSRGLAVGVSGDDCFQHTFSRVTAVAER